MVIFSIQKTLNVTVIRRYGDKCNCVTASCLFLISVDSFLLIS